MAPPKPTSPRNPSPASTPDNKKHKVTPQQVAFLVERYLADNSFAASLAAFRSDAAALFGKPSSKLNPKGLIPLADILHDYIALKETRLAVDSAMQAMGAIVSNYYGSAPTSLVAAQPSSPPLVPPYFVGPTASSSPPHPPVHMPPPHAGTAGYATPMIHYTQSSSLVVQNSSNTNTMSTSGASSLPTKKRKASAAKSAKTTSASKRTRTAPTSSNPAGKSAASKLPTAQPSSAEHSVIAKLPVEVSTVAKSLFKPAQPQVSSSPCTTQQAQPQVSSSPCTTQQAQPQVSSSPCTTQQSYPIADEPASHLTQRPSPVVASAPPQQDIASSQYSIVSSQTVIVSPMKGGTYYSVERSCHVSSPLKSSTQRFSKREHVKGRLDFDSSDARPGSTELVCQQASSSTTAEKQDDFVIDFTNFDIFGDFSMSELLVDFDLDNEGVQCENPSSNAEVQRLQPIAKSNSVMADPIFLDSVKPMEADSTGGINSQGASSVTSVRAITKRIKIVSPVKGLTTELSK